MYLSESTQWPIGLYGEQLNMFLKERKISVPMIPREKILMATPIFSRSRNSMNLFSKLCDASGSHKSKMEDGGSQTINTYILASWPVFNMAAHFQLLNPFHQQFNEAILYIVLC